MELIKFNKLSCKQSKRAVEILFEWKADFQHGLNRGFNYIVPGAYMTCDEVLKRITMLDMAAHLFAARSPVKCNLMPLIVRIKSNLTNEPSIAVEAREPMDIINSIGVSSIADRVVVFGD